MRAAERSIWLAMTAALLAAACWERAAPPSCAAQSAAHGAVASGATGGGAPPTPATRPRAGVGARLSMDALHRQGGVPLGWEWTPPPGDVEAGRGAFERLGCGSCHRVASDDPAAAPTERPGPDLTGMGSHHPAAYLAEAILNPDAVVIDGPGYVDASGHSTMPTYDDLTLGELRDLVAYLTSLRTAAPTGCHASGGAAPALEVAALDRRDRPAPRALGARVVFTQTYDVLPGRLDELEAWFARDARPLLDGYDGVVGLDTFVDAAKPRMALTTAIGLRDEAALRTFLGDPRVIELWQRFDALVGPHGHHATDAPLVYRAPDLSLDAQ